MESRMKDFTYTRDQVDSLLHKRKIDAGGYGDVHEMYHLFTGQCFARKLLHLPNPRNKEAYIRNEARAVRKLCNGRDPNVIHVYAVGEFAYSSYYFIDMELCDLSMQGYLYPSADGYIGTGLPPLLKDLPDSALGDHIWNIMKQIASGLKFIHANSEAHRDLKPSNVLYSRKDSLWKLTDFGLASETTASHLHHTTSARGSDGYRAPELASDYKYSNKVDIWTMGCLLYEIAVGKRAFHNDYAVLQYCERNDPILIFLDDFRDEKARPFISDAISRMLQKLPSQRPTAAELHEEFSRHCRMESPRTNPAFAPSDEREQGPSLIVGEVVSPISSRGQLSPTVADHLRTPERQVEPSVEESFRETSNALIDLEERDIASPLESPMYLVSALSSLSPSSAYTNFDLTRSPASVTPLTPFDNSIPLPSVDYSIPEFSYEQSTGTEAPPPSAPRYRPPTRSNSAVPRQDTSPAVRPPKLAIKTTPVSDLDLHPELRSAMASPAVSRDPQAMHPFVSMVERRDSVTELQKPWLETKVPLSPVQKLKSFLRLGKSSRNNPWLPAEQQRRHDLLFPSHNNVSDEMPGAPSPSTDRRVNRLGGRIRAD